LAPHPFAVEFGADPQGGRARVRRPFARSPGDHEPAPFHDLHVFDHAAFRKNDPVRGPVEQRLDDQPVAVRVFRGNRPHLFQKAVKTTVEKFRIRENPHRYPGQSMDQVRQQDGFEPREMIDDEDDRPAGDILLAVQVNAGLGKIGDGLDGQPGGAIGESVHGFSIIEIRSPINFSAAPRAAGCTSGGG
jgi:hypothetical protein